MIHRREGAGVDFIMTVICKRSIAFGSYRNRGQAFNLYVHCSALPETQDSAPPQAPDREVWTRVQIVPGLEIHVSKDLEEKDHRKMSELLKIAKLLMKEDTSQ